MKRFRAGLAFKAHRLLFHSTLGSRVIKKTKEDVVCAQHTGAGGFRLRVQAKMGKLEDLCFEVEAIIWPCLIRAIFARQRTLINALPVR